MPSIRLERVTFAHHDAFAVLDGVSAVFPDGWTGLVGENGAGKSTLLQLVAGVLRPQQGRIRIDPDGAPVVLCRQDVELPGDDVRALAERDDGPAWHLRGELALEVGDLGRWGTLSPGERRRWQIGAALAREPRVLLLDEPTNHLDATGRALVVAALERFRGVGLLVSHDRGLLEALTCRTARLHHGQLALTSGHYGEAREIWHAEQARARDVREAARARERRARRALAEARSTRAAAERSLAGSKRDPKDRDARSLGAQTKRAWAEARLGGDVRRLRTAAERAAAAVPEAPVAQELGRSVFLGYSPSPRPIVLSLDAPELRAGGRVLARDLHLVLRREDRVRFAGPNGAGKTTLLLRLLEANPASAGQVFFLRQEVAALDGVSVLERVRALPPDARGGTLSLVAALGTDPDRLLASAAPSAGEVRKLLLAEGLARRPWAVVLDEPTNHLDLPTVERLGAALEAYSGALLLVTHDDGLAAQCTERTLELGEGGVVVR
ncbi:MAG TPA: ATP-binding cassette domain-containing protein [Myxococcaceae bacterium]|nr:ATP-binding cassette domain-containing protein [Myxococcaceae bacterium]